MPINFAAIVPHPPIAIPTIGKEKSELVKSTVESLNNLSEILYQSKIDTIIIISGHGQIMDNAFSINHSPELQTDLSSFGDLTKYNSFKNDMGLSYQIREHVETQLKLSLYNDSVLDYGTAIPLFFLAANRPLIKVIPIKIADLNYEKHIQFGEFIKEVCFKSDKRVAVIASADLSHKLAKESPGGYSPKGKEFDNFIIDSLKNKKVNQLINIDSDLVKEASTCGLRSILILLGVIKNMNYDTEIMSYEQPIGVGYLTVNFHLN